MLSNSEILGLRELVLNRVFRPEEKKRDAWLRAYSNTIDEFLGLGGYSNCEYKNKKIKFESTLKALNFTIAISDTDEFNATLSIDNYYLWSHHVDNDYRTVHLNSIINTKKSKEIVKKLVETDIRKILNDLLFHPEVHQHIEIPDLSHEYRIGGGISNIFQFLMHLRYQMCDETAREAEIIRLTKIVFDHVSSKTFNCIDVKVLLSF